MTYLSIPYKKRYYLLEGKEDWKIPQEWEMLDSYDTLDDMLHGVLRSLLAETTTYKASKGEFKELFGCCLHLKNPRGRLSRSEGKSKVFSALGELMWYLSKETKLNFIDYYIPARFQQESDDQISVRSGYGERLFSSNGINQVDNVIKLLKKQNSSRRAVIQLFDASDLTERFASIPCTCTLQFIARDGHLHMFVAMRSNDAFLGLPHDVFSFTMLQELVARSTGLEVGEYKHCAGSLHLYSRDVEAAGRYLDEGFQSKIEMAPMPPGDPWESIAQLQAYEKHLRLGGETQPHSDWHPYWQNIASLLDVYKAYKDKNLSALQELSTKLHATEFRMFVQAKTDALLQRMEAAI